MLAQRFIIPLLLTATSLSGCFLVAAAGLGAEAGYVAAQDDRTASETLTDQRITATLKTQLIADPDVSGLDINVDTMRSWVTLKGLVSSSLEAERAIHVAESVSGVRGVTSKLVIDSDSPNQLR